MVRVVSGFDVYIQKVVLNEIFNHTSVIMKYLVEKLQI